MGLCTHTSITSHFEHLFFGCKGLSNHLVLHGSLSLPGPTSGWTWTLSPKMSFVSKIILVVLSFATNIKPPTITTLKKLIWTSWYPNLRKNLYLKRLQNKIFGHLNQIRSPEAHFSNKLGQPLQSNFIRRLSLHLKHSQYKTKSLGKNFHNFIHISQI
jgi:hypothetical protein